MGEGPARRGFWLFRPEVSEVKTELVNNCGACPFWSPILRQEFLGICGQRDRAGTAVDKLETCEAFEKKSNEKDYLE